MCGLGLYVSAAEKDVSSCAKFICRLLFENSILREKNAWKIGTESEIDRLRVKENENKNHGGNWGKFHIFFHIFTCMTQMTAPFG